MITRTDEQIKSDLTVTGVMTWIIEWGKYAKVSADGTLTTWSSVSDMNDDNRSNLFSGAMESY